MKDNGIIVLIFWTIFVVFAIVEQDRSMENSKNIKSIMLSLENISKDIDARDHRFYEHIHVYSTRKPQGREQWLKSMQSL